MKPFTKRLALVTGLLFTALLCMGIVFIDNTNNYWRLGGTGNAFVQLIVSNRLSMSINTNTGRIGFNGTNQNTFSVDMQGVPLGTNSAGNGTSGLNGGRLSFTGSRGGGTFDTTTASGGAGGPVFLTGGAGGDVPLATTNATGGNGGALQFVSGVGADSTGVATNATTSGNGGAVTLAAGAGGAPSSASTNTVGGDGGSFTLTSGLGGSPGAGWARKGGNGGSYTFGAANGGIGTRTNSGNGGSMSFTAGSAVGTVTSGNPGKAGDVSFSAGAGATGDTNGNGGKIYLRGGNPGSTATPGNVYVGRDGTGSARGGLVVGLGEATLTNVLSFTASLDFPSIAAGTVADLQIAAAGAADGDVVTLSVPLSAVTNCMWMAFASNAVVWVRAANGQLVTAQDPNSGTFRVVVSKFQ